MHITKGGDQRGGRGGASGRSTDTEAQGANVARELAETQNGKDMKEMYHWFNEDRKAFLQDARDGISDDGEFDRDHTYVVIDNRGEVRVLGQFSKPEEWKEVKAKETAYMSLQTGDGFNDSNGFNTVNSKHDSMRDGESFREGYDTEIEYIYNTAWAKRHPRK